MTPSGVHGVQLLSIQYAERAPDDISANFSSHSSPLGGSTPKYYIALANQSENYTFHIFKWDPKICGETPEQENYL